MKGFEDWDRSELLVLAGMFVTPFLGTFLNYLIRGESSGLIAFLRAPSEVPVWIVVLGTTILFPLAALWVWNRYEDARKPTIFQRRMMADGLVWEFDAIIEKEQVLDEPTPFCPNCKTFEIRVEGFPDTPGCRTRCPQCDFSRQWVKSKAKLLDEVTRAAESLIRNQHRQNINNDR